MIWRSLFVWAIGTVTLAYTPSAPEILSRMEARLRTGEPVQARVIREAPSGRVIEEVVLTVPGQPGIASSVDGALDLPFALVTLPTGELAGILPTVVSPNASVSLGRLAGEVCYILEGARERMWISKSELLPLKIEFLTPERLGTSYLYIDMVELSEAVRYPSRTEVWRDGDLVLVERLLPAAPSTNGR